MVAGAFTITGFELDWNLEGDDPAVWCALFRSSGSPAVVVDPSLLRAAEPLVIEVDPQRACRELGWAPQKGLEVFLGDMITKLADGRSLCG
jgi:GDP-D-mannose dehydratase